MNRLHNRRLSLQRLEPRDMLAAAVVDTELDVVDPLDGRTSLREAISAANDLSGPDTIQFSSTLTGKILVLRHGELTITDDLTMIGLGLDQFGIDASGNDPTPTQNNADGSRVFNIDDGDPDNNINVMLEGLLLFGGDVAGRGGGIYSTENFTLRSSRITSNAADYAGGGLFIATTPGGSAAIYDSIINVNFTTGNTLNLSGDGGGAYITARADSRVTIANSQFSNNSASKKADFGGFGGGLYAISWQTAEILIRDSTISGNSAVQRGGGLYARSFNESRLELHSLTITDNRSNLGAGVNLVSNDSSAIRLSGSVIEDNTTNASPGRGGGMHVVSVGNSQLTIVSSTIRNNRAGSGGGIYANAQGFSHLVLNSLLVRGNTVGSSLVPSPEDTGGGITAITDGAGEVIMTSSTISNNLVLGNSSGGGGGIMTAVFGGSVTIASSTIVVNQSSQLGGGIWNANGSPPILKHTIVASNGAFQVGDDIAGEVRADWSLVEDSDGASIVGANNLLDIDPILTSIDDNCGPTLTFAPRFDSPVINAGDPAAAAGLAGTPLFDQRGAPYLRVAGGRIDIGAVEIQTTVPPLPGDYNNSGAVDTADYVVWRRNLGQNTTAFAGADGNGDTVINDPDYAVWRANFGRALPPAATPASSEAPAAAAPVAAAAPTMHPSVVDVVRSKPSHLHQSRPVVERQLHDDELLLTLAQASTASLDEPSADRRRNDAFAEVANNLGGKQRDSGAATSISRLLSHRPIAQSFPE